MTGDSPEKLYLVAFEPLGRLGFALPLFGHQSRANTLYVACCDPSGDPAGQIVAFELFEPYDHRWLPEHLQKPAFLGGPWLDVFIEDEALATGSPDEIWEALAPRLPQLRQAAPLSVLDAAINANSPLRDELAAEGRRFIEARFGAEKARDWAAATMMRKAGIAIARAPSQIGGILKGADLNRSPSIDTVSLEFPDTDPNFPDEVDEISRDFQSLADALELNLLVKGPEQEAPDAPATVQNFASLLDESLPVPDGILILAAGPRARALVRHIDMPAWLPKGVPSIEKDSELRIDHRFKAHAPFPIEVLTTSPSHKLPYIAGQYDVVVLLIDDDQRMNEGYGPRLAKQAAGHVIDGGVLLLAPALREDLPTSAIMEAFSGRQATVNAILDTSQARSPFWWGSTRRSLDRRISDIVIGGALLAKSPSVRKALLANAGATPPVLAFAITASDSPSRREEVMLASESTWVNRSQTRLIFSHEVPLTALSREAEGTTALVEGRSPETVFDEFARAVLRDTVREARFLDQIDLDFMSRPWGDQKVDEDFDLISPRHATGLVLEGDPSYRPRLLITAEAPTLRTIRRALELGWRTVRYTDRETLLPLLVGGKDISPVPAEIRLPKLQTPVQQRRLVTRGFDQRDVIRFTEDQLQEWLAGAPSNTRAALLERIRPIRATRTRQGRSPTLYALRRKDLRDMAEGRELFDRLGPVLRANLVGLGAPHKRLADLGVAWSEPPRNLSRFAILDGELPPVVVRLEPGQVVEQSAFTVDGDEGTSALFRSRAFALWARATLSRSSSWMSRFSAGSTFAAFPMPDGYSIQDMEGRAYLDSRSVEPLLVQSAADLEVLVQRDLAQVADGAWRPSRNLLESSSKKAVDEAIIRAYGLEADVDDLELLTHLVELNRSRQSDR